MHPAMFKTTPRRVPVAFALGLLLLSLGCGESGKAPAQRPNSTTPTPANPPAASKAPVAPSARVESLAAVDVSELIPSEQRLWVDLINTELSPCGEPIHVGTCVSENRGCRSCLPAAKYLARMVSEGIERASISQLYALRYDPDKKVEIDRGTAPIRGGTMAPITIVEFSDFQCPACKAAHPILARAIREFDGRVRMVFKNFPLAMHDHAVPAAKAGYAAGKQGKFWEMHDALFESQPALEATDIDRCATSIGLDLAKFHADMNSPEAEAYVQADRALGETLKLEGTPSIYINGRVYPTELLPTLSDYLKEELAQQ